MRYDTSIVEASSARAENLNASFGSSSSWEDAASAKRNAASAMPEIAFIAWPPSARLAVRGDLLPGFAAVVRQVDVAGKRRDGVLLPLRRVLRDISHRVLRHRGNRHGFAPAGFEVHFCQCRRASVAAEPEVCAVEVELHGGRLRAGRHGREAIAVI